MSGRPFNRAMAWFNTIIAAAMWLVFPLLALRDWTLVIVPLFFTCAVAVQWMVFRKICAAHRPRPDYTRIASLEREVYGKTFEHEGVPETRAPEVPPTMPPAPPLPRPRRKQTLAYDLEVDGQAVGIADETVTRAYAESLAG